MFIFNDFHVKKWPVFCYIPSIISIFVFCVFFFILILRLIGFLLVYWSYNVYNYVLNSLISRNTLEVCVSPRINFRNFYLHRSENNIIKADSFAIDPGITIIELELIYSPPSSHYIILHFSGFLLLLDKQSFHCLWSVNFSQIVQSNSYI